MPDAARTRPTRIFWLLHSAGWCGVFLLSTLSAQMHGKTAYWKVSLPVAATGFVVTLGLRYLLRALADVTPWRLIALMAVPVLLACGAMALVLSFAVIDWCGEECRPSGTLGYIAPVAGQIYVVMTWVGLYVGIKYDQRLRLQTEAALAARAIAHQAQLRMLRYQLNPHFLFNTLNAISTLILDRDTTTANRTVQGLSAFLRHSLDNDPEQRVTLEQELAALDLYLDIEAIRFAERLRVEKDIAPECRGALLPSLLLQPLVENAIKYAVAPRVEGGTLRLSARHQHGRLCLSVADDGPGIAPGEAGTPPGPGVGLRNTRERLRVLYGIRQSFYIHDRPEGGCEVRLTLPFETAGPAAR